MIFNSRRGNLMDHVNSVVEYKYSYKDCRSGESIVHLDLANRKARSPVFAIIKAIFKR